MALNDRGQITNTMTATSASINSFISDHVLPAINNWERNVKEFQKVHVKKPPDEQRRNLAKLLSTMTEKVLQLQHTFGYLDNLQVAHFYKDNPQQKRVTDDMLMIVGVWQKQVKKIKDKYKANDYQAKRQELHALLSNMQSQIQMWSQLVIPTEIKEQQQKQHAQHGRNDGQQPSPPATDGRYPVQPATDGRYLAQPATDGRHPVQPATDRRHPVQPTTDGRYPAQPTTDGRHQVQPATDGRHLKYKEELSQQSTNMDELKKVIERQREELKEQTMANRQITREKEEALNRLSEIAGRKLQQNNPGITDLSTENRPTKIAERFKELYANQWTDAFTDLTDNGYSDPEAINILLVALFESFEFTADISEKHMKQLEQSAQMLTCLEETEELQAIRQIRPADMVKTLPVGGHLNTPRSNSGSKIQTQSKPTGNNAMVQRQPVKLSGECADLLKQLRKASAPAFVPEIQTRFLKDRQARVELPDKSMTNFYNECADITWYMNVQTPPLALAPKPARGTPVKTDLYSVYTQSGVTVDYVVWPACLLHENGPLLTKGIVQPFKAEGGRRASKQEAASDGRQTSETYTGNYRKSVINESNVNLPTKSKTSKGGGDHQTKF